MALDLGQKVLTNSLVSVLTAGVYILSRLALTPFILAYVSLEEFGLWGICFTILGYALVNGPGVQGAFIKYSAEYAAEKKYTELNRLLSTGFFTLLAFCCGVFLCLMWALPHLMNLFHIHDELKETAYFLISGTTAIFLIDALFSPYFAILSGLQEIARLKLIWLAASLIELLLIVCLIFQGLGIQSLLWAYCVRIVVQVCAYVVFAHRHIPTLTLTPRLFCPNILRIFCAFGGRIQLISFMAIFMDTFDKLVATYFLGLGAAGLFEIGRKFPKTGQLVITPAFAPLLPAASHYRGQWVSEHAMTAKRRVSRYCHLFLLSLVIASLVLVPFLLVQGQLLLGTLAFVVCLAITGFQTPWMRAQLRSGERLESEEIRALYLSGMRHSILLNASICGLCAAFSPLLVFVWVGAGYEGAGFIMVLISVCCFVNLLTGPGTQVFRGSNRMGRELEYLIIQMTLAIFWAPFFASFWGINGAIVGTLAALSVACLYFLWQTHDCMGISKRELIQKVGIPVLIPLSLSLLFASFIFHLPLIDRQESLLHLVGLGGLFFLSNILMLKEWVLNEEEWGMLTGILLRKSKKG